MSSKFLSPVATAAAYFSNLAYSPPDQARDACFKAYKTFPLVIDMSKWFEDLRAYVFTMPQSGFVFLTFRGTQTPQDWCDDLQATPVRYDWMFTGAPALGEIHAGFGHALCDAWKEIVAQVDCELETLQEDTGKTGKLFITGHSLGGALAALAGLVMTTQPDSYRQISGIYTFGQPRFCLHSLALNYERLLGDRLFRFVNEKDLVPRVPFRGFDYADVGQMIHFTDAGAVLESQDWANFLSRTFQGFEDLAEILKDIRVDIGDHSMAGYQQRTVTQIQLIENLLNS